MLKVEFHGVQRDWPFLLHKYKFLGKNIHFPRITSFKEIINTIFAAIISASVSFI